MNQDIAIWSFWITIILMILGHAGPIPNKTSVSDEIGIFIGGFLMFFVVLKLGYLILT